MNLSTEDKQLLEDLCRQQGVSKEKVHKLLETVYEYEFKDRREALERGIGVKSSFVIFIP